jgi:HlyD family secretion protein
MTHALIHTYRSPSSVYSPLLVALITLIAAMSTGANAADKPADKAVAAPKPALTVSLVKPQQSAMVSTISANGSVAAWQEASVSAEVSGLRLIEINAQVGDTVKKGQVLARFSQDTLNAEIAATKAQLAEAQASADEARASAQRARDLAQQGFYSSQAISQANAQEKAALARLDAANANLTLQDIRLQHSVLRAPDSGIITARNATIGSVVATGTELFRMNRLGRLEWRGEVTTAELHSIKRGSTVLLDGGKVKGTVRQIAPNLDPLTRNAIVLVDVAAGSALKVGQFVRGEFSGASVQAMTVPASTLVLRDGFTYVFVVNGTKASLVKVTLGQRQEKAVQILSGITEQSLLVVTGAAFLTDGDTVKVVQP